MFNKRRNKERNISGKAHCDICGQTEILVQHHIDGRNVPHANKAYNLSDICPNCHAKIHSGILVVEKWVMTTEGKSLIYHSVHESSLTGNDAKPYVSTTKQNHDNGSIFHPSK
jgi:hypothetical protein